MYAEDPAILPAIIGRPGLPKSTKYHVFRSLVSWQEDTVFTRLHTTDPHWRSSRKTPARAFSADEIRCALCSVIGKSTTSTP